MHFNEKASSRLQCVSKICEASWENMACLYIYEHSLRLLESLNYTCVPMISVAYGFYGSFREKLFQNFLNNKYREVKQRRESILSIFI